MLDSDVDVKKLLDTTSNITGGLETPLLSNNSFQCKQSISPESILDKVREHKYHIIVFLKNKYGVDWKLECIGVKCKLSHMRDPVYSYEGCHSSSPKREKEFTFIMINGETIKLIPSYSKFILFHEYSLKLKYSLHDANITQINKKNDIITSLSNQSPQESIPISDIFKKIQTHKYHIIVYLGSKYGMDWKLECVGEKYKLTHMRDGPQSYQGCDTPSAIINKYLTFIMVNGETIGIFPFESRIMFHHGNSLKIKYFSYNASITKLSTKDAKKI